MVLSIKWYVFLSSSLVGVASVFGLSENSSVEEKLPITIPVLHCGIEIGSGLIRMGIADVSQEGDKRVIHNVLAEQKTPVLFAENAAYNNNTLSEHIYQKALVVLKQYKAEASQLGVRKIHGIATDIFRKAENGSEFIEMLSHELDFEIEIIDQNKEGELGFLSIAYEVSQYLPPISMEELVSWDAGSSSTQITVLESNHEFVIYKSPFGIIPIKVSFEKIRRAQFGCNSITINPVSDEEIELLLDHIINSLPEVPKAISEAVRLGVVVRKFNSSWLVDMFQVDRDKVLTKKEVKEKLDQFSGKSDDEIRQMIKCTDFGPEIVVLSLVSLYAMMDKLDISSIRFARIIGNTCGILLDASLWQEYLIVVDICAHM